MKKTILIALGGSIIAPLEGKIDINFLKKFRRLILDFAKKNYRFIIVVGGGKTSRIYQKAASKITKADNKDLDWIGIYATWLNAQLLKSTFGKKVCPIIVDNPLEKIKNECAEKQIIIAGGWKPGWSTDFDAVLLARRFKIKEIIDAGNIDFVYTKDLNKFKNAKPIKRLSWNDYRKLIGSRWVPGLPAPIDPIAAREAEKLKLRAFIIKGTDLKNLKNLILNRGFRGTTIE